MRPSGVYSAKTVQLSGTLGQYWSIDTKELVIFAYV
jgi:hypothetical protein